MDQIKMGKFIAELRRSNHLTQEKLGEELGVTNKTISRWENGHYSPDVEMLRLLSNKFDVSINELISGERISDDQFKEAADKNLIHAWEESSFTLNERIKYWKSKWMKEHIAQNILTVLFCIAFFIFARFKQDLILIIASQILPIAIYLWLRNRMMIYIESHAF